MAHAFWGNTMEIFAGTRSWLESNRDLCIEALRIYLGIGLFLKGIHFLFSNASLNSLMDSPDIPFFSVIGVHLIGMAHIVGGTLLAMGLLTRIAALIQVPILFGAVLFVHWSSGLFSTEPTLEFTLLVLFLLLMFSIYGPGRLSIDHVLARKRTVETK